MSDNQINISLKISPNAARNEIIGFKEGILQVKVAAPPVKGKANTELIAFLSKTLDVGKSSLSLIKGHTSRNKVIAIQGMNQNDIITRLSPIFSSGDDATRRMQ